MDPMNFNNKNATRGAVVWYGQSFFCHQQAGQDSSRQCKEPPPTKTHNTITHDSSNNSNTIWIPPPPKPPKSTPARRPRGLRKKEQLPHNFDQKQSRSQSVRGATNLSKETRLLKSKLDRLFASHQETVVASWQSQATQLESLKAENQQLRAQLGELETETLKQFSELEDCEELLKAMDERRLSSHKEASAWKLECEKLTKEVVHLKEFIEEKCKHQRTSGFPEWGFRDEKPRESLLKKSSPKADFHIALDANKENTKHAIVESDSRTESKHRGDSESNPSLIAARGIFGNQIPASFLNTEQHHRDDRSTQYGSNPSKEKTYRRKSFHAMTLRARQANKKCQS